VGRDDGKSNKISSNSSTKNDYNPRKYEENSFIMANDIPSINDNIKI
jgi:hypothetical protein